MGTQEIMQIIDELDAQDYIAMTNANDDSGKTIFAVPQSQSSEGIQVVTEG